MMLNEIRVKVYIKYLFENDDVKQNIYVSLST